MAVLWRGGTGSLAFQPADKGALWEALGACAGVSDASVAAGTLWTDESGAWADASFVGCTASGNAIEGWDTGLVTDMSELFFGAASLSVDISGWDTSAVTNMESAFKNAAVFNSPIGRWNTSSVTNMRAILFGAIRFQHSLANWDLGRVNVAGGGLENMFMVNDAQQGNSGMGILFGCNNNVSMLGTP